MTNIKKLESDLWESADLLRQGSKLTGAYVGVAEAEDDGGGFS
jgi:hypothetical protein